MEKNEGHEALLEDLESLLDEAKNFEFDDFKNENYPAPKMALRDKLIELATSVADGKYDQ